MSKAEVRQLLKGTAGSEKMKRRKVLKMKEVADRVTSKDDEGNGGEDVEGEEDLSENH